MGLALEAEEGEEGRATKGFQRFTAICYPCQFSPCMGVGKKNFGS